jgi:hypothetical protein
VTSREDRHNAAMQKFIRGTLREMVDGSRNYAELAVMLESIIFGVMLLIIRVHNQSPQVASGLAETALQAAMERLAAHEKETAGREPGPDAV